MYPREPSSKTLPEKKQGVPQPKNNRPVVPCGGGCAPYTWHLLWFVWGFQPTGAIQEKAQQVCGKGFLVAMNRSWVIQPLCRPTNKGLALKKISPKPLVGTKADAEQVCMHPDARGHPTANKGARLHPMPLWIHLHKKAAY